MYNEIVEIRPYFHSLREFNTDVSLDIKIPISWEMIPTINDFPNIRIKEQDKNDKTKLISYVSYNSLNGYDEVFRCVKLIIKTNLEKEKKERLLEEKINELKKSFEDKMNELKKVFDEKDLSSLENLNIVNLDEHKTGKGTGFPNSEGFKEDSVGTSSTEEENN